MSGTRRAWWLRRDLLIWLMLPLLAVVAATGAVGTYTAQRLTDKAFDRWLLDTARSLAGQVHIKDGHPNLDLPAATEAVLGYDEIDQVYFSVSEAGHLLAGQQGIPRTGTRQASYRAGLAYDAFYAGHPVRVAAATVSGGSEGDVLVLVAETTRKRQRAQSEVLLMLLPVGALLLAAAAAIGYAVRRTLNPLEAIAARWNERSHASLQPIAADDMPRELMPFATALNDLLARIRAMLAREQQFAATVAHQLRTPLAGLQLGVTRAAEAGDLDSSRAVLGELGHTVQRTARLVQQLLALGRLDPEVRGDLHFAPTDVVALAHDVGSAFLEYAATKSITLELDAPDTALVVSLQPELFSEALGNLLDNALRYTPEGGQVLIEFDAAPPAIRISDTGPGVPDELRDTVFERFVRGQHVEGQGSGLGLAIVRDIVALHGATVTLTRSASGGACVTIRFSG
ncbi:MAG TPA: sensor histidine kinase N-terminal domain-containing protein [Variovorax sp.]